MPRATEATTSGTTIICRAARNTCPGRASQLPTTRAVDGAHPSHARTDDNTNGDAERHPDENLQPQPRAHQAEQPVALEAQGARVQARNARS